jgi:hypothetical protein
LLLSGYEGMKQQEEKIPVESKQLYKEAVEWLYQATDRPELAAKLRTLLTPGVPK